MKPSGTMRIKVDVENAAAARNAEEWLFKFLGQLYM
jgi:hypothetical protein